MKAAAQALDDPAEASRRQAMRPARAPEPDTTAEQILAAAARLFGRQGYRATTLRQIAQEAGIKAGSVYYHFDGKEGIAARVLDAGIDALTAAVRSHLDALPAGGGARQRLAAAVEGHLWGMLHHGDFTAAHIRIYRNVSDAAKARHQPVRSAYTRLWDELLADCAAAGVLRCDIPVTMVRQFLVGALNWPVDWYDPQRGSFERVAAQITALVFDGIVVEPERAH
jgi:AcrR family transcriptional regulator